VLRGNLYRDQRGGCAPYSFGEIQSEALAFGPLREQVHLRGRKIVEQLPGVVTPGRDGADVETMG
jgi:hypothetical protein